MQRYQNECELLADLAKQQLNLKKNACKSKFENMKIESIFNGLLGEVYEVKQEIFIKQVFEGKEVFSLKEDIDFTRLEDEIGDCAGYLAGLLAWIHKKKFTIT